MDIIKIFWDIFEFLGIIIPFHFSSSFYAYRNPTNFVFFTREGVDIIAIDFLI